MLLAGSMIIVLHQLGGLLCELIVELKNIAGSDAEITSSGLRIKGKIRSAVRNTWLSRAFGDRSVPCFFWRTGHFGLSTASVTLLQSIVHMQMVLSGGVGFC